MSDSKLEKSSYLTSFGALKEHLDEQKLGAEKGDDFEFFACDIIPYSDIGKNFKSPERGKKSEGHQSHDDGIDVMAVGKDGCSALYVQVKYSIRDSGDFDKALSDCFKYNSKVLNEENVQIPEKKGGKKKTSLPVIPGLQVPGVTYSNKHFMIFTMKQSLDKIIQEYEKNVENYPCGSFYSELKKNNCFHYIDGSQILRISENVYSKSLTSPDIKLNLEQSLQCYTHSSGKVYIGVTSGAKLYSACDDLRDAIFFENIREFLGSTSGKKNERRENVNKAIARTIEEEPQRMLSKNNGIVFRAEKVLWDVDNNCVHLTKASIVNGCQTATQLMSNPKDDALVQIKIVEARADESWDIAKAANYQNPVEQIKLDLARFIRPQIVKRAAAYSNFSLGGVTSESLLKIMRRVHKNSVDYESIYSLFIALFSNSAANALDNNYTEIRNDVLEEFHKQDPGGHKTFQILFNLSQATEILIRDVEEQYSTDELGDKSLAQRFWRADKDEYRSLLTIIAACGTVKTNIYSPPRSYSEIFDFLQVVDTSLKIRDEHDCPKEFIYCGFWAFQAILTEVRKSEKGNDFSSQQMFKSLSKATTFESLYEQMLSLITSNKLSRKYQ